MLTIIFIILVTFADALDSVALKKNADNQRLPLATQLLGIGFWRLVFTLVGSAIFIAIDAAAYFNGIDFIQILIVSGLALLLICQIYFWLVAAKNSPVSILDPIALTRIAIFGFASWMLFGEALTPYQITLMGLVMLAAMALGWSQSSTEKNKTEKRYNMSKGLLFLGLWLICACTRNLVSKAFILDGTHPMALNSMQTVFFFVYMLAAVLFIYICQKQKNKKTVTQPNTVVSLDTTKASIPQRSAAPRPLLHIDKTKTQNNQPTPQGLLAQFKLILKNPWLALVGLAEISGNVLLLYLYKTMNMGLLNALLCLSPVLVIIAGRFIFKEKLRPLTLVIAILIVIGCILLNFNF